MKCIKLSSPIMIFMLLIFYLYKNHSDHARPRYLLLAYTYSPLYLLKTSTSEPPFLSISSSSEVHRSLASFVYMYLSRAVKSPESWSNL